MHFLAEGVGGNFFGNLGGILTGLSELLGAIGAGVGFLIRSRRNARRERLRSEAAAALAAKEAQKNAEQKQEAQFAALIKRYEDQLAQERKSHEAETADLRAQISQLQNSNASYLDKLLNRSSRDDGKS